jgi:hypothetical protein
MDRISIAPCRHGMDEIMYDHAAKNPIDKIRRLYQEKNKSQVRMDLHSMIWATWAPSPSTPLVHARNS